MNTAWLLDSRHIWWVMIVSSILSLSILWLSPVGLRNLAKRKADIRQSQERLLALGHQNKVLLEEVARLRRQDPETMEGLARSRGYAKPGETVYTFRDRPAEAK